MSNIKKQNTYEDIINLAHPTSMKHKRMSRENRAAQFAPFAALTGYEESIQESARLVENKKELSEAEKQILNTKLIICQKNIDNHPIVVVEYYVPDMRKNGGKYEMIQGRLISLDFYKGKLKIEGASVISFADIYHLESIIFESFNI